MKLSIITINFNNKDGLEKTIRSVVKQSTHQFEFIIVDGGSTDGSVDVIKKYEPYINKWVSESDKGIYNAMNKGARMASGDYITFVNSGDTLADDKVIADVTTQLGISKNEDLVFGKVLDIYSDSKSNEYSFSHKLTLMTLHYDVVNHSGCFIRRDLQLSHPYREDLKICSDRQFFIETVVFDNCSYSHIDRIITHFDKTGISCSSESSLIDQENELIFSSLVPPRIVEDYKKTNLILTEMTSKLTKYYGLSKLLCRINLAVVKFYSLFRK